MYTLIVTTLLSDFKKNTFISTSFIERLVHWQPWGEGETEMGGRGRNVRGFEWRSTNEIFWGIFSLMRIWDARLIQKK